MADSDDFTLDLEETDGETDKSNPMKQIRDHARSLERKVKQYETELTVLRQFKEQYDADKRDVSAGEIFSQLGLTEKQAKLFTKLNPDTEITVEAARSFAEEYGFEVNEDATEEEEAPQGSFSPSPTTGGKPAPGKIFTSDEWYTLYKANPAEAMKIVRQGRVKLQSDLTLPN